MTFKIDANGELSVFAKDKDTHEILHVITEGNLTTASPQDGKTKDKNDETIPKATPIHNDPIKDGKKHWWDK